MDSPGSERTANSRRKGDHGPLPSYISPATRICSPNAFSRTPPSARAGHRSPLQARRMARTYRPPPAARVSGNSRPVFRDRHIALRSPGRLSEHYRHYRSSNAWGKQCTGNRASPQSVLSSRRLTTLGRTLKRHLNIWPTSTPHRHCRAIQTHPLEHLRLSALGLADLTTTSRALLKPEDSNPNYTPIMKNIFSCTS